MDAAQKLTLQNVSQTFRIYWRCGKFSIVLVNMLRKVKKFFRH